MKNKTILIVEDEPDINRLVELLLKQNGFNSVLKAFNGKEALDLIEEKEPDLILLDVMLPFVDGFEVLKIIKNNLRLKKIPVIMLTARRQDEDILKGFDFGAIDYVTKPFKGKILIARIKAHLQKDEETVQSYTYKELVLDVQKRNCKIDGEEISLTKFEYEILLLFVKNKGRVYSRDFLLNYLKGNDGFNVSERAIDFQILNLRKKLGRYGGFVETVRGLGYKIKED